MLLEQLNYIFSKVFNAEQMYFSHLKNGTSNYIFRYQENIKFIDEFIN